MDVAKRVVEKYGKGLLDLPEDKAIGICSDIGKDIILKEIQEDLKKFKVHHDRWFSERSLVESGAVDRMFSYLKDKGLIYEKDGALWFLSTNLETIRTGC